MASTRDEADRLMMGLASMPDELNERIGIVLRTLDDDDLK